MVKMPELAGMAEIRRELSKTTARLAADTRYTDDARRNSIAAAYVQARQQADKEFTTYADGVKKRRTELERQVFGLPGGQDPAAIVSYRDAQDRVDAIDTTSTEQAEATAQRMFDRARNSGDIHLAKALLQRATHSGWTGITSRAEEIIPNSRGHLEELHDLPSDKALKMIGATQYKITTPREIDGAAPADITAWAKADKAPTHKEPMNWDKAQSIPGTSPYGHVGETAFVGW